jgi:Glycosyl transferase 4-like domain
MCDNRTRLPRLLYVGDVPVEASYQGSALVHRVLDGYDMDNLSIVEGGVLASEPNRRLSGAQYHVCSLPWAWLHRTRIGAQYWNLHLLFASRRRGRISRVVSNFLPEAILTVPAGVSWITAAEIAHRLNVPLHLICHDEWVCAGDMQDWKDRIFGKIYRRAASRLCVSPFMAEEYERRYGAPGEVLYPSRAADAVRYDGPPARLAEVAGPLTCVFAGTINSAGAVAALKTLAASLAPRGGLLLIYGPLTAEAARASGLEGPNIELRGLVSSAELLERLRTEADVLYVPMSFAEADRNNMQISFPSKLTDYTAVGLPLLIHGPQDCSAVRWAQENSGVAEVVSTPAEAEVEAAVERLRDREYRLRLGRAALEAGERYFSHCSAAQVFHAALLGHKRNGRTIQ